MIRQTRKRTDVTGMSKLIHAAFVTYLLSYALPAVVIAGDLAFGFQAAILSFFGSYIGLGYCGAPRKRPDPCVPPRRFGKRPDGWRLRLL